MTIASAPGKFILFGEHAVVFGQPAIAVAIDLRCRTSLTRSNIGMMNGHPISEAQSSYVGTAIRSYWGAEPLSVNIASEIPSGSGLGSSAAVTCSTLAALHQLKDDFSEETVAREGFEVESQVQGRASPTDTSTSSHGKGIFIGSEKGPGCLWEISKDTRRWFVHHLDVPKLSVVVGYSGHKGATGPLVAKVKRYVDRSSFARDIIEEIGALTLEGAKLLKANDRSGLGSLMTKNHKLLAILGVSSPQIDKLVQASLPYSYGAKLTGAGGGGSMIALTDKVEKVCEAIKLRGGVPYVVHTGVEGVKVE